MRVLIVDDEFNARRAVRKLVGDRFPELNFLNDATSVNEAIEIIKEDQPDIVLLDVQLDKQLSFEIFDEVTLENTQVIFITAYDNHALDAFEHGAINYILKPIRKEKLYTAVEKAIEQVRRESQEQTRFDTNERFNKILIPGNKTSKVIDVSTIVFAQAEGVYCHIYLSNGGKELLTKPLNYLEERLKEHQHFLRTHKSFLVNISSVTDVSGDLSTVSLTGKHLIPVSRTRKEVVRGVLERFFY